MLPPSSPLLRTKVFIVERYHYKSTSQQLPKKDFQSLHRDAYAANAAAETIFQQLLKEHIANLGYLESGGLNDDNGLFRGSFTLRQARFASAVERVGIQVRREVIESSASSQPPGAVSAKKKRKRASMETDRGKKFIKPDCGLAVRESPPMRKRGLVDGFSSDITMDEVEDITSGQKSDLIIGIC